MTDEQCTPMLIKQRAQLGQMGVAANDMTWCRVTMCSDAYICVRQRISRNNVQHEQIRVISLDNKDGAPTQTFQIDAQSAKISPSSPNENKGFMLALQVGDQFLVMKLDEKSLRKQLCTTLDDVEYWTWLDSHTIGLVTDKAVFHWLIEEGEVPQKIFNRHQRLDYSEIISYKTDPTGSWFALTGLSPQADCIVGDTQLYSADKHLTQCIHAHAVLLTTYRFTGNLSPSVVLCTANRDSTARSMSKVHVVELGPNAEGNLAPWMYQDNIDFEDCSDRYDFPVSLQASTDTGLLYVITKYAQLNVYDIESATYLCSAALCAHIVFTTTLNAATNSLVVINTAGEVLDVGVNLDQLIQMVRRHPGKRTSADRLEKLLPLIPHRFLV